MRTFEEMLDGLNRQAFVDGPPAVGEEGARRFSRETIRKWHVN
jgi:hypothetical protein